MTYNEGRPMKVFLSYTPDEYGAAIAPVLGQMLSEHGYEVWDPEVEVFPGDNGSKAKGQALEKSDAMIVLLTPQYMLSWSWQDLAYALGNERYRERVVAVLVEGEHGADQQSLSIQRLQRVRWNRHDPFKVVEEIEHALKSAA